MMRIWIAHFGLDLLFCNIECQFGLESWVIIFLMCEGGSLQFGVLCLLGPLNHTEVNNFNMERERDTLVISFLPPGIRVLKKELGHALGFLEIWVRLKIVYPLFYAWELSKLELGCGPLWRVLLCTQSPQVLLIYQNRKISTRCCELCTTCDL